MAEAVDSQLPPVSIGAKRSALCLAEEPTNVLEFIGAARNERDSEVQRMNANAGSIPWSGCTTDSPIRFKVLVVDQPGPHLQYLAEVMQEVGYNVDAASDPETAYRKLRSSVRPVDLLVIDLECLSELDGLHFLKALKKEECCANTQLIITTHGLLDERLSEARTELAIRACFNKARPVEELLCLVTALLPPRGHNLRAWRRFPVRFLVKYSVGETSQLHHATNLSLGGIFIRNSQPDPVGTLAKLAFTLPGSAVPIQAKARVVRVAQHLASAGALHCETFPPGNGLVFSEISEEHWRLLREFCEQEEARIFGFPTLLAKGPAGQAEKVCS